MRRKSDKEIKKENAMLLVVGILCILVGLFMLTLPLMHATSYQELTEAQVTIKKFDRHYGGGKFASYDYIVTEDGDVFNVTGEYSRAELEGLLSPGTAVTIKYSTNRILPFKQYAEEMTVDGLTVVAYNNHKPIDWTGSVIFCIIFCLLGVAQIIGYCLLIRRNRKMQEKRDARIIRKYGKTDKGG
ncbi:MAG: hypothetical protein IJW70_06795 [Clostridia bacterium]|nr:hypothetical protein [Clostridia bacterium]